MPCKNCTQHGSSSCLHGDRLHLRSWHPYALATAQAPQEPHAMQCEFSSEQHAALHAASYAWNFQGAQLYSQMSEVFSSCANVWSEFNMSTLAMKKFLMRRAVVEPLC